MKHSILFLWVAVLGLALWGCNPDEEEGPRAPIADASALNPFFEQYRPVAQTFTVDAQSPGVITGAQGTAISFGQPPFGFGTGNVYGQVQVELLEAFSRGDMLLLQKPTVSAGRLLISAGQVLARATQGGNHLTFQVAEMRVPLMDSAATEEMQLYYQSTPDEYGFSWQRAEGEDSTAVTFVPADSTGTFDPFYRVAITADTLGWLNISHLFNQSGAARAIYGQLHGLGDYTGFVTYCVFEDVRALSPFTTHVDGEVASNISLPDGLDVKLISFGNQNGQFYYGETTWLSGPKFLAPQITVAPISESELVDKIRGL